MVIPRGGQTWVSPVRFTPTETGEVEFVFELYSSNSLAHIVRKTLIVYDPMNSAEAVN